MGVAMSWRKFTNMASVGSSMCPGRVISRGRRAGPDSQLPFLMCAVRALDTCGSGVVQRGDGQGIVGYDID